MTPASTEPLRMCVGCRERRSARSLLRFRRRSDGVVVFDLEHRRTGRSAWVCPTRSCLGTAVRRRAFHRALAGSGRLAVRDSELGALVSTIVASIDERTALLCRTAGDASAARTSALAALRLSLHDAGEVA